MKIWGGFIAACLLVVVVHAGARTTSSKLTAPPQPAIGSESAPLHIRGEVITTAHSEPDAIAVEREGRKERSDEALVDYTYWLVAATFLLALAAAAQVGLFLWQLRLIAASSKDAGILAEATKISADALRRSTEAAIALELPVLRFDAPKLHDLDGNVPKGDPDRSSPSEGLPTRYSLIPKIDVYNFGRTAAHPKHIRLGSCVAKMLPATPAYDTDWRHLFLHGRAILKDASLAILVQYQFDITDEEIASIYNGKAWLWLFGVLCFDDYMGETRNAPFCWRYANRNHPSDDAMFFFESDGDPPAAYIRDLKVAF